MKRKRKHKLIANVSKKQPTISMQPPPGTVTRQAIENFIVKKTDEAVKSHIFPLRHLMDRRYEEVENLVVGLLTVQSLLITKGIVSREEYENEFNRIMGMKFGLVSEGAMSGYVHIEVYNIEDKL